MYLLVVCGIGFLPEKVKGQLVPCLFCGGVDSDGHFFWENALFPPLVEISFNILIFHGLVEMDSFSLA